MKLPLILPLGNVLTWVQLSSNIFLLQKEFYRKTQHDIFHHGFEHGLEHLPNFRQFSVEIGKLRIHYLGVTYSEFLCTHTHTCTHTYVWFIERENRVIFFFFLVFPYLPLKFCFGDSLINFSKWMQLSCILKIIVYPSATYVEEYTHPFPQTKERRKWKKEKQTNLRNLN